MLAIPKRLGKTKQEGASSDLVDAALAGRRACALTVGGGKAALVGDEADVIALAGPHTRVTESGDGMVMPGAVCGVAG
jgi:hypothetical protein